MGLTTDHLKAREKNKLIKGSRLLATADYSVNAQVKQNISVAA